jgi:hypothetical protein
MSFKVGDIVRARLTGRDTWAYYGTVLEVKPHFGHPATLAVRLDGILLPDGDRTAGIDDPDDPTPTVTRYENEVDYYSWRGWRREWEEGF